QIGTHIEPQGMDKRKQKLTGFVLSHLLTGFICRPHFIAYDINSIDEPVLGFLRNIFSMPVYVWTLHSLSDAEDALTRYEGAIFEKE
ncbi:MAG TPA: hypothetical protein PLT66_02510, partial [Bacillota bacterium]|nr:hypothetical protein [Bacillota bacterium]